MSDKNGFGTGGTSPLLTPASTGNNSCQNTTHPAFTFSLPSALQQCGQFVFDNYKGAIPPIEFIGVIPQGNAFPLITKERDQFTWTVNAKAGTQIIWVAQDSKGNTGGTSDLLTVQLSGTSSCIDSNSPSSTATSQPSPDHSSAILGGAIGGGLAAILLAGGGFFLWLKKRRRDQTTFINNKGEDGSGLDALETTALANPYRGSSSRSSGSRFMERNHVRPMPNNNANGDYLPSPFAPGPGEGNLEPNPFVFPSTAESETTDPRTRRSSKAGMMSTPRTPRFILHTDAEDEGEEEEVVELPPQYKPSRAPPLPSQPSTSGNQTQLTSGSDAGHPETESSYPPSSGHAI